MPFFTCNDKKLFQTLVFVLIISGCRTASNGDLDIIEIDPYDHLPKMHLDELSSKIDIIPLSQDLTIGRVEIIKAYDNIFYVHEAQREMIHLIDSSGNLLNTLDRRGRGPEEYLDIGTFSVDPLNRTLTIFSRHTTQFMDYSIPDLTFKGSLKYDKYVNAMEYIDSDKILTIVEDSYTPGGVYIYDRTTGAVENTGIDTSYPSLELSVDHTMYRDPRGKIVYVCPGFYSRIYEFPVRGGIANNMAVTFGRYNIPKKKWDTGMESDVDFGDIMRRRKHALWPHFPVVGQNRISFWYMASSVDRDHSIDIRFYILDIPSGISVNIGKVRFPGTDYPVYPSGTGNESYIGYIEELTDPALENYISAAWPELKETCGPALYSFRLDLYHKP